MNPVFLRNIGHLRLSPTLLALILLNFLLPACTYTPHLMPTPNLYTGPSAENPFADVPSALQTPYMEILYVTDREPENQDPLQPAYGYKRSRSVAFGLAQIHIKDVHTWDQLVHESRIKNRD